jgi:hypothetical protein
MTDWIEHDGGPQPIADDVWVYVADVLELPDEYYHCEAQDVDWPHAKHYRIINQHLIDAARLEGIRLGLEAAHMAIGKGLNDTTPLEVAATIMRAENTIVDLDPEIIAKEADQ